MNIASCFPRFFTIIICFRRLYGIPEPDPGELGRLLAKFRLEDKTGLTNGEFRTLDLSGGQRRRLALIVSMLEKRPIMLLDEWTAEQDPEYRRKFYDELLPEMMRAGKTVVVITHDDRYLDELHLPARRIHMEEGRIVNEVHNGRLTAFDEERVMTKYPELLDGNPPMEEKRGWWRFIVRRLPSIAFPLLVAFLAITDAVAFRGDHGSERPCRRAVEAIQYVRSLLLVLRRPRHDAQSAAAARRRPSPDLAVGQAVHL